MIASGNQNQFPSSFAPLRDLLKAFMFLSNLNGFNSSPSPLDQRFTKRKGSSKVWKENGLKWFSHFSLSPFLFMHYLFVLLSCFWVSLVLCFTLFNMFLFVFSFVYFVFNMKINWKIENQKNAKTVCVLCTLVLVYLGWPLKQSFLNFVSLMA